MHINFWGLQQLTGQKCFEVRGQRRTARLLPADRKAAITQLTIHTTEVCRRSSLEAQYIKAYRIIAAESQEQEAKATRLENHRVV